jgi:DNA mismatch repair protein MLH1
MSKKDLLQEYFAMTITSNGLVESLPLLLRRYTPNLDRLPLFLMRLGPQVFIVDYISLPYADYALG